MIVDLKLCNRTQAAIKETNDYHSREIERLPQQSQAKIEHLLSRSIKQNSAEFLR
ncbi:hypothetical protein HMPREF2097_00278 [Enterococcus faecalis 918]|nr:hypothetical protein HMPREF2097_00278 [Enterococcus faecalis 918]